MVVVAGGNRRLEQRLSRHNWQLPVHVVGFTSRMAEFMAAADVLLTKAGPGTIAEAACLGLPTLLTGFVPGQEEHNVAWAHRNGGAVFQPVPKKAAVLVDRWLEPKGVELAAMATRMASMGRPDASRAVADASLALLQR
jgi:1,2-diacylglycerol 3-beta-galactosyltransferase